MSTKENTTQPKDAIQAKEITEIKTLEKRIETLETRWTRATLYISAIGLALLILLGVNYIDLPRRVVKDGPIEQSRQVAETTSKKIETLAESATSKVEDIDALITDLEKIRDDVSNDFAARLTTLENDHFFTATDIGLGELPNSQQNHLEYPVPNSIPSDTKEILVSIFIYNGDVKGGNSKITYRISTVTNAGQKASFDISMHQYGQTAISYSTENFWLPLTENRQVVVDKTVDFGSHSDMNTATLLKIIGYR